MISASDRRQAVEPITQARWALACEILGLRVRTVQRWTREGCVREDQRPQAVRPKPAHALGPEEEQATSWRRAIARSSPIYRRSRSWCACSMRSSAIWARSPDSIGCCAATAIWLIGGGPRPPSRAPQPTTYQATGPNQVWSWDCTGLPGPVKGLFFFLVMIVDIYSRKVVGWEVFHSESAHHARLVIERAVLAERVIDRPLVLHSDNGSAFKGAKLLEKLHEINITSSFSRPRVSNDNALSEALFRTCKYVPDYPVDGFESLEVCQRWVHRFVGCFYHAEHRHSAHLLPHSRGVPSRRGSPYPGSKPRLMHQAAWAKHPERWSGPTRNWDPITVVSLNPEREPEPTSLVQAA